MDESAETMNAGKQVAIVTGASAGIGRTVALRLADDGFNVVLAARSIDRLSELQQLIESNGGSALAVTCDVSDSGDLTELTRQTLDRFGRIDVLINNAGVECFGYFETIESDQILETINVNFTAAVLLTGLVIPVMLKQKSGCIINMASTAGKHCPAFGAVYGATKAALIGFTEGLRGEYLGRGISATAVCPGFTKDGGIYERMTAAVGRGTPTAVGSTTAGVVANAVIKAIRSGPPELIVNWPPMRPVVLLKQLFPRFAEKLILASSRKFTRKVADVSVASAVDR
ncbi:MAG: SDR family NAD(P)-dependent oxidoreductase [Fuerstiella sp.]|nr:SDR family NAD(P)-dependent oxidoreductase [Fuerstiella sp.]